VGIILGNIRRSIHPPFKNGCIRRELAPEDAGDLKSHRSKAGILLFPADKAPIKDIEKLTAFADYQVPKGLCSYGILEYSDALRKRIRNKEILDSGSREELEIRANTIYSIEKLLKEINLLRNGREAVNAVQMDYHLWKMARKEAKQYHLTVTTAY